MVSIKNLDESTEEPELCNIQAKQLEQEQELDYEELLPEIQPVESEEEKEEMNEDEEAEVDNAQPIFPLAENMVQ